jgi:BirA family transcriptional regulator, biotin operon repressor / biotin---[acetyl-CoA-carboxylase] ligase
MALDPAEIRRFLKARRLGTRIECLAETDSTNTDLVVAARGGAPEGSVIIAESQRRGRGRLGRSWVSPAGLNLYCSVLLRPDLAPEDVPLLTLTAGVAVADAVAAFAGGRAAIKWPNDVLLDERKVAGILTEMEAVSGRAAFVVVGIGVNLNSGEADFPPEVRSLATSIALATGQPVERARFAAHLLDALDARYESVLRDGFSALLPAWSARDALRGRRIEVRAGDERIEGVAAGLAPNGRLILETSAGPREIMAGDVSVIGGYRSSASAG